jgi:plastocyanin
LATIPERFKPDPPATLRQRIAVLSAATTLAIATIGSTAPAVLGHEGLALKAGVGEGTVAGQAFMPGDVTIAVGDSLTFSIGSDDPHTITMGAGPADVPPFAWPAAGFTAPAEGLPPPYDLGVVSTDGTDFINTGILAGVGSSATIEFSAPGTFQFFCAIHPHMTGQVTVVEEGPVTTQEEADAAGQETRQLLLEAVEPSRQARLNATSSFENGDGTRTWNIFADAGTPGGPLPGGGTGHLELLEFTPAAIEIAAGDTINWTASQIHTVTFLPEGVDPEVVFPTEEAAIAPVGGTMYDGTEPTSSGFLGIAGPDGEVVRSYSLTSAVVETRGEVSPAALATAVRDGGQYNAFDRRHRD